jgi:hypothetical protein
MLTQSISTELAIAAMPGSTDSPTPELVVEARRILDTAQTRGMTLRAFGGVAVWLVAESARTGPFLREYKDLDFVGRSREARVISSLLEELGYTADAEFNKFHGASRLIFVEAASGRSVDVFLDRVTMCHSLELGKRLGSGSTLDPADLLLSKLQVVETNERDLIDALALLADGDIDIDRIVRLLSDDWGWWRTATTVLERVERFGGALPASEDRDRALTTLQALRTAVATAPRSLKWRLRARVGDRVRWYELPDEIEGQS